MGALGRVGGGAGAGRCVSECVCYRCWGGGLGRLRREGVGCGGGCGWGRFWVDLTWYGWRCVGVGVSASGISAQRWKSLLLIERIPCILSIQQYQASAIKVPRLQALRYQVATELEMHDRCGRTRQYAPIILTKPLISAVASRELTRVLARGRVALPVLPSTDKKSG